MLVAVVVYAFRDPTFLGADFRAFYTAGTFLRTGRSAQLYDVDAVGRFQAEVLGTRGLSAWLSPPYWAWAYMPLSRLPFVPALVVHSAIALALGALALTMLERELGVLRRSEMAWVAACYYPTLQGFIDGQNTALWALMLTGVFVLLRRGRDGAAGVALGCFALKPQLAIGLVAALLGARRLRSLAVAALTAAAWVAVGYLTLPAAMREYFPKTLEFGAFLRSEGYPVAGLHSLFQLGPLLLDAFSPRAATAIGAILTALALAVLVAIWAICRWEPGEASWDRRMAATLALSTIASPHLFGYDLMLLLVPLFIVWRLHPQGTNGRPLDGGPILGATALGWGLALVGPALTVAQQAVSRWAFQKSIALQLDVPIALLWIWLVYRSTLHDPGKSPAGDIDRRPIEPAC
jgi:Glycosyltransferase family 87